MWARSQNRTSNSQCSLQSRLRPPDYTHRSVRAHILVPARNVRVHIPVPATSVRAQILICTIGVRARPSFPSALAFPLSTESAPDIPYAPLRPRPTTHLHPLARRCGSPGGSQRRQGKSDLPWPLVNAHLTLTGRVRRSIGRIGRAGGPPHRQPWVWRFQIGLALPSRTFYEWVMDGWSFEILNFIHRLCMYHDLDGDVQ
jgi:hypothetical protein